MSERPLRIAMVAGEVSGDILASGLIREIKNRYPDAQFEGIGGELMLAEGFHSRFPMERLSVMGLTEVLGRLRELLGIRKQLIQYFIDNPPDVFIGIDAPDFNLTLERKLKQAGIKAVHYVSPSVWAWRENRVHKIVRSIDLMLTLFPFEVDFYARYGLPARFVGHRLADDIPLDSDPQLARQSLGLPQDKKIVALLPGSRGSEVKKLTAVMLQTAQWCLTQRSDLHFVVPLATSRTRELFEQIQQEMGLELPLTLVDRRSREVMQAADVILLASGTATLEAALMKRPMVVCYRQSALTHWLMKRMAKVKHVSLPNILANQALVPEFLQQQASVENMGPAVLSYLSDEQKTKTVVQAFYAIHQSLKQNASVRAADAVLELIHADKL
ncbi:MAG: lipid-A-disaccharide synthase [Gammaproteobacteria bacterium]|nr:lipid-A-disaccharide synthase [Gammaproteobacteria bacterium]